MRSPRFSEYAAETKADAFCELLNGGRLVLFDGAQPASPDENVSTQVALAAFHLSNPAFELDDRGGRVRLCPLESVPALASGRPTWFRFEDSDGHGVLDGSVGPQYDGEDDGTWKDEIRYDLRVDSDIEEDGEVRIESFVYVERRA